MTDNEPDKVEPDEVEKAKKPKTRRVGQVVARGNDKYQIRIFLGRDSAGKRHYFNENFHGKRTDANNRRDSLMVI